MTRLRTSPAKGLAELAVHVADGDRLARGRRYQRKGKVSDIHVEADRATACVYGSRDDPYEVMLDVRRANENVRRAVASGDVDAAVPGPGEIALTCVCPDWGDPCKHGVAVLLEFARHVDDDPAELLRWRGIDDVTVAPPAGTESLSADPAEPVEPSSVERLKSIRSLRAKLGSAIATPVAGSAVDSTRAARVVVGISEGAEVDEAMSAFFGNAIDVEPVPRLEEVQAETYRTVRIMLEGTDAAPVIADAVEVIADHWLGR